VVAGDQEDGDAQVDEAAEDVAHGCQGGGTGVGSIEEVTREEHRIDPVIRGHVGQSGERPLHLRGALGGQPPEPCVGGAQVNVRHVQ
jgi:hypothetical protein